MKTKTAKFILVSIAIIILISVLGGYILYTSNKRQNTVDQKISRYIKANCTDFSTCKVNLVDFTDFDWDAVCFVDSGASLDDNPSIVPAPLPKNYSFMNPKIVFLKRNSVVLFEEIPTEVEYIPPGTVLFDTSRGCMMKSRDLIFNVEKDESGGRAYYFLKTIAS
jgi:hypothetical protein